MNNRQKTNDTHYIPQIKICGLTNVDEAQQCAALGVNAIGFVFFPKSPRYLTEAQAKEISASLPQEVCKVGVFVNETFSSIMDRIDNCNLTAVQLHGQETPELVKRIRKMKIPVIKALFSERSPSLQDVSRYDASSFLAECGKGKLPGGNALAWNWGEAKRVGEKKPFILAGGLAPDNVVLAIDQCGPDAVDVSSGVESAPGKKDLKRVKAFVDAVSRCGFEKKLRRIF